MSGLAIATRRPSPPNRGSRTSATDVGQSFGSGSSFVLTRMMRARPANATKRPFASRQRSGKASTRSFGIGANTPRSASATVFMISFAHTTSATGCSRSVSRRFVMPTLRFASVSPDTSTALPVAARYASTTGCDWSWSTEQ